MGALGITTYGPEPLRDLNELASPMQLKIHACISYIAG